MADVFISYKSERRPAVEHLKRVLENYGYSVWFDYGLLSGQPFARLIEREIRSARAVVVLWCNFSITSRWVLEEASLAEELSSLVPARIDQTSLPFGYRSLDTIDLASWDGNPRSGAALDRLLRQIAIKVGRGPAPEYDPLAEQEAQWLIHRKGLADFPLDKNAERLDEERDRQTAEALREAEAARLVEEARTAEAARQAEQLRQHEEADYLRELARRAEEVRVAEAERLAQELLQRQEVERLRETARLAEEARIAEETRQAEILWLEQEEERQQEVERRAEKHRLAEERRAQRKAAWQARYAGTVQSVTQMRNWIGARKPLVAGLAGVALVSAAVVAIPGSDTGAPADNAPKSAAALNTAAAPAPTVATPSSPPQLTLIGTWAPEGLSCAQADASNGALLIAEGAGGRGISVNGNELPDISRNISDEWIEIDSSFWRAVGSKLYIGPKRTEAASTVFTRCGK